MSNALSRRRFLALSGAGAIAVLAPQSPMQALAATRSDRRRLLSGGGFAEGVLSGDPTPNGITLLTRMTGTEAAGQVRVEIATDRAFDHVVASKDINTSANAGHSVKARIAGLRAGERYFYRFHGRTAESPVGRFQTAPPADSRQPVRFAFFSCQEFTLGYFNAHRLLAREDVDFVINLGDYIYSDLDFGPPNGVRELPSAPPDGAHPTVTFDEYCQRYRDYRSDADLRAMHAQHAMISCWDDHDVQNDYAGGDPHGGEATSGGLSGTGNAPPYNYTVARRDAAYRAFFRSMPTYAIGKQRLYHRAAFGRHVDLFVLDERQYRASQPCGDVVGPACAELPHPRAFLGRQQNAFLRSGLTRSRATWKVIANEVVMMGVKTSPTEYEMFDAWQGYPTEREALLQVIRKEHVKNVVFVTGDYHAYIAGDVQTAAKQTVATEFVGGSITTPSTPEALALAGLPGSGTPDHPVVPADQLASYREANPYYKELDFLSHGYVVCEAGPDTFKATYRKLATTRARSTRTKSSTTYTVHSGRPGL